MNTEGMSEETIAQENKSNERSRKQERNKFCGASELVSRASGWASKWASAALKRESADSSSKASLCRVSELVDGVSEWASGPFLKFPLPAGQDRRADNVERELKQKSH